MGLTPAGEAVPGWEKESAILHEIAAAFLGERVRRATATRQPAPAPSLWPFPGRRKKRKRARPRKEHRSGPFKLVMLLITWRGVGGAEKRGGGGRRLGGTCPSCPLLPFHSPSSPSWRHRREADSSGGWADRGFDGASDGRGRAGAGPHGRKSADSVKQFRLRRAMRLLRNHLGSSLGVFWRDHQVPYATGGGPTHRPGEGEIHDLAFYRWRDAITGLVANVGVVRDRGRSDPPWDVGNNTDAPLVRGVVVTCNSGGTPRLKCRAAQRYVCGKAEVGAALRRRRGWQAPDWPRNPRRRSSGSR